MNNKDNFEISQELEQMRQQFDILSRRLDEQNIVTDGILRSCAKEKITKYNNRTIWIPLVAWAVLGGWIIIKQIDYGMPQWSNIMTVCVVVLELAIFLLKKIQQSRLLNFNAVVKVFSQQVKQLKNSHLKLTVLSGVIAYIWVAIWIWLFFSMYPITSMTGIVLLVVYVAVMSFLHLRAEMKALHILDEIVRDIEQ